MSPKPTYTLIAAKTQEEKDAIYRFRFDVFGREMGLLGPLELWEEPSFFDPADEQSHHIYAESDGVVVGSVRIAHGEICETSEELQETYELAPFLKAVSADQIAIVTRLMVNQAFRGSVLNLQMLKQTAMYCLDTGIEYVFLDCQPHLVPLYQRYGFRPYRSVFNDPYVGVLVPLVMVVSDFDYLERVRSPFSKMIKSKRKHDPELAARLSALIKSAPSIISEEIQGDKFFKEAISLHIDDDPEEEGRGFIEGLKQEEVDVLVRGSYMICCKQGDVMIHHSHATRTMFLVMDGALECKLDGNPIAFVGKGGVVGEFAYLSNTPRTADVEVVSEEATLLAFEKKHMVRLIETHPRLAALCLFNLSQSLCMKFINHAYPVVSLKTDF